MDSERYISFDEAQDLLGSSKRFVYKQVEIGTLNLYKVGRKSYVKESEVQGLFKPASKSKTNG